MNNFKLSALPNILPNKEASEYTLGDILVVIGNVIEIALLLAGTVALIYIIIGGYKYIVSAGNPEAVQQAKQTILWAVVGLIIALSAFAIINFLWENLAGKALWS